MFNSAKFDHESVRTRYRKARARVLRQFCRDEEGGILIMALLLLIIMLVMGGMAVDFMRFESRRALLQSVSDRAVLAAAELDQTLDPADVVEDYFEKAGFGGTIVGAPLVTEGIGSRSVQVQAQLELNTFYLRLIGIPTLDAPAASGALEGTGNIEISMVLDISGSMDDRVYMDDGSRSRKYLLLREAASNFVDALLIPDYKDQISISMVQYTSDVNIGDEIFDALNVADVTVNPNNTSEFTTNLNRCIDFAPEEFSTTVFDTARTYVQVEMFDPYTGAGWGVRDGQCPKTTNTVNRGIIPLTQDANRLKTAINAIVPTRTTAIHLGTKWGVSLLDPSMRDLFATVPTIDPMFRGERPSNYATANDALSTVKYLVLMTDGENVATRRLRNQYMDEFYEINFWNSYNFNDCRNAGYCGDDWNQYTYNRYSKDQADNWLQSICTAARNNNITIFTIAMGATENGEKQMRDCAGDSGTYFETAGDELNDIFQAIAQQITDLRLSL